MLNLALFSSGAAALLFEALWLRRAGLVVGSSVWASSIVLAAFMAGLAVGNAVAIRLGARVSRPLRLYARLEILAGVTGAAVVLATPALAPALAPLFRRLAGAAGWTHGVRVGITFLLVLVPTTAMGMTLPMVTRAVSRDDRDFGRVLGRAYGWNTLGGVFGAVAGELWLVAALGVRGTALCAAGLNLAAAALVVRMRSDPSPLPSPAPQGEGGAVQSLVPPRLLAAAFLSGASLLALEVIWFRFLQLFLFGTTLAFAFMLAVILLGVAAGGLAASRWLRRDPSAHGWLPAVAGAAALATVASYAWFSPWYGGAAFSISQPGATLTLSLRLMLPTALVSGALFTLQGAALARALPGAAETTGALTLANTLGAMTGALGAGFGLLPAIGMERSIFVAALAYAVVGAMAADTRRRAGWVAGGAMAAIAVGLVIVSRGAMDRRHLATSLSRFVDAGTRVVAMREGVNQTTTLLRSAWKGETLSHRLVTNGHSMSGTELADRRYMKMFVYWALAVNPNIRDALLVSYGLGSTAKALTDTRALATIDVVDVSPEILDLAGEVFPPGQSPLGDARVRVHVEDGRFFLQTTAASFDLITGEPPPPKAAGIVNLYSRAYFQLLHGRLRPGGVATYWLPVEELDEDDARAITGAFCASFADCSLWTGAGPHWMLAGTRALGPRASETAFTAQWRDDTVGPELIRLGLETPEQLGATFLADAEQLAPWIAPAPPLDDDHPHRLSPRRPTPARQGFIDRWMEVEAAAGRFERSKWIAAMWPPELRQRTSASFATQRLVNAVTTWPPKPTSLEDLRDVLTESKLETLPLLLAGTSPRLQDIAARAWARGDRTAAVEGQVAFGALARRDYRRAAEHFAALAGRATTDAATARKYQTFASMLADPGETR